MACGRSGLGDFDGDRDVDLDDFAALPDCAAGPGATPDPPDPISVEQCRGAFDIDEDTDVDLSDFGSLQRVFGGQPAISETGAVGEGKNSVEPR